MHPRLPDLLRKETTSSGTTLPIWQFSQYRPPLYATRIDVATEFRMDASRVHGRSAHTTLTVTARRKQQRRGYSPSSIGRRQRRRRLASPYWLGCTPSPLREFHCAICFNVLAGMRNLRSGHRDLVFCRCAFNSEVAPFLVRLLPGYQVLMGRIFGRGADAAIVFSGSRFTGVKYRY